jgi:hypothetical protein
MRSACGAPHHALRSDSGSFAKFAAIRALDYCTSHLVGCFGGSAHSHLPVREL